MQSDFDDLLLRILDQPESKHREILEAAGASPELCSELLDLVAREADFEGFPEKPAALGLGVAGDQTVPDRPPSSRKSSPTVFPETVGPYTVTKILGEGGMGVVYLAEQHEPVKRQLAVKVIRANLTHPEAAARFAAERQALAQLSHPNIAQLFEAGTTEQGYPYFAMEYFPGEPITDYCDRHRLSIDRRLSLFATICDAVQHAHQRGIIHRDLKPSNILVAEVDGLPAAKVIDFGIAKAIDQPLAEALELTGEWAIGTPAYMSPESLRLIDGVIDVDTRTDVYGLGILLYKLLTGTRPFVTHCSTLAEVRAQLAGKDAPRPSTRLASETEETRAEVAHQRRTEASTLQRRLKGDLDWIVSMAIAWDREDRYGSAADFAVDVRRYLDHKPVMASPPSVHYRVGKFVRRNRALVAAGLVAVLALVLGTIGITIGMLRADREAERANREAALATETSEFLTSMFEVSDPRTAGGAVTAHEVLDRSAEEIQNGLQDQPLLRAQYMVTIGRIYKNLGHYDEAEQLLEQALEIRESTPDSPLSIVSNNLNVLGEVYKDQGRYDEAMAAHERALEIQERVVGPDHPMVARSLIGIGSIHNQLGRYREAEPVLKRSLEIRREIYGPDHPDVGTILNELALLYDNQGLYDLAEPLYRRALSIKERSLGPDHIDVALALNNLALLNDSQGRPEQAEPMYRRALEIYEKVLGPDHPDLARSLNNLGLLYDKMGRYDDAVPLYQRAVEINTAALGPDHWHVGVCLNNLAVVYTHQERYAEAEPVFQRVLTIYEQALGTDHPRYARTLFRFAQWHVAQGLLVEAESLFERAMAIQEKKLPADHPKALATRAAYADLLRATGRQEAAAALE